MNARRKLSNELLRAAVDGDEGYMEKLLSLGINTTVQDGRGLTPLHFAAHLNHTGAVLLLLSQGADINAVDNEGLTPLHLVAFNGTVEMAQLLISRGANTNAKSFTFGSSFAHGSTPLHLAARMGQTDIVKLLLESSADINATDSFMCTPLREATTHVPYMSDRPETLEVLVKTGVDVKSHPECNNHHSFKGQPHTALHDAITHVSLAAVRLLVEAGADVDEESPIIYAVGHNNFEVVQYLVEKGANVNGRGRDNNTALHEAARYYSYLPSGQLLIAHGADIEARNSDHNTPLHLAAASNNSRAVSLLLEKGADANALGAYVNYFPSQKADITPLHFAAASAGVEIVKELLLHGADVNAKTHRGTTPLHIAVLKKNVGVVRTLLEAGADANAKARQRDENNAREPSHVPMEWIAKEVAIAKALMAHGAVPQPHTDTWRKEREWDYSIKDPRDPEIPTSCISGGAMTSGVERNFIQPLISEEKCVRVA